MPRNKIFNSVGGPDVILILSNVTIKIKNDINLSLLSTMDKLCWPQGWVTQKTTEKLHINLSNPIDVNDIELQGKVCDIKVSMGSTLHNTHYRVISQSNLF